MENIAGTIKRICLQKWKKYCVKASARKRVLGREIQEENKIVVDSIFHTFDVIS